MKKVLGLVLCLLGAVSVANAQSMNVILNNGNVVRYKTSDVNRVEFDVENGNPDDKTMPIVGTWTSVKGSITFNADGTTNYGEGYTYKYDEEKESIVFYNSDGNETTIIYVYKVTDEYIVLNHKGSSDLTYYYKGQPVSSITLSQSEINVKVEFGKTYTCVLNCSVAPDDAAIKDVVWSSSNPDVVKVSEKGELTALASGSATITCSSADCSGVSAKCSVVVTFYSGTNNGHEYVDLGLPSGTLWATCNIGADMPDDYGDYFAWGETTGYKSGKTTFDWSTYKWCYGSSSTMTKYCEKSYCGTVDNKTELDLEDDAAHVKWGGNWRMPSREQIGELINSNYTTTTGTTQNGVYGRLITSKSNGNSVFLPAAGYCDNSSLYAGSYGYYWSRSLYTSYSTSAYDLLFYSNGIGGWDSRARYYGYSVRPVCVKE